MQNKVYIVAKGRSAIGNFGQAFAGQSITKISAQVLSGLLEKYKINKAEIQKLVFGQVMQSGCGQNTARQIALETGLSPKTTAFTVNMVCGSGMQAIVSAYLDILSGKTDLAVAGGGEFMSNVPHAILNSRTGTKYGSLKTLDLIESDGLTDSLLNEPMGLLMDKVAANLNITKEEAAAYSDISHKKAFQAQNNVFKSEIIPVTIKQKKAVISFTQDEHIRPETTTDAILKLPSIFSQDGITNAGNASGINDGVAFVCLASKTYLDKHPELKPLAEIVDFAEVGVKPENFPLAPFFAIQKLIETNKLSLIDLDLLEVNEAFAHTVIANLKLLSEEYKVPYTVLIKKTNVCGGAVALGHPLGMSGARVVVSLITQFEHFNLNSGIASLCIGGGQGIALYLKKGAQND